MAEGKTGSAGQLRILHVLRAPVGGLYRHVLDLAREQISKGHAVGLIADSSTGGDQAARTLGDLEPHLRLGLLRIPMQRAPHPSDLPVLWQVSQHVRALTPDVVHGHGSKGGLFARMSALVPGRSAAIRVYTPHGGSLNYRPGTVSSRIFMRVEWLMARSTDLLLFESAFVAKRFRHLVGEPQGLWRVVHNGIADAEFVPVVPRPDAADIVYVGELRAAKGIDTLLDAMPRAARRVGRPMTAVLVGTGPDLETLKDHTRRLGLAEQVQFLGPLAARKAFELGRMLVVPSRAESLPYVILEAAGARIPIVTTHVGGIPEIFGPLGDRLLPPDDATRLADRIADVAHADAAERTARADSLAAFVHDGFTIDRMVDSVLGAYHDALAHKRRSRWRIPALIPISSQQPEL